MSETWLDVVGAEGRYQVSSNGRVWSAPRRRTRGGILRTHRGDRGYLRVTIDRRGRDVHLLVAEAFHGPRPTPAHEACHQNGDQLDNAASNLAWGTKSENRQDSVKHGTHANAAKDRCPEGHLYDEQNTLVIGNERRCRKCGAVGQRRRRALSRRNARTRARTA